MQINIQSLHFRATEPLETFVRTKVEKLPHINHQIISGDVILKLDNSDINENKVCEIQVHIPGNNLFAKRQNKSFEEATNEAVAALQEQLLKRKK
jgi:putative sigma-54 modulation protein